MGYTDFLFARPGFVTGVARLFDFGGTLNTYNVSPSEEMADTHALQADWRVVGDDMRIALATYRKQQKCEANV